MYDIDLEKNEDVVKIFEDIFIKQGDNEKYTTIILTNKRMLFLDYLAPNEGNEVLRVARGANYFRYKEIYYQFNLDNIKSVSESGESLYKVILDNKMTFEFDNDDLYDLLIKNS